MNRFQLASAYSKSVAPMIALSIAAVVVIGLLSCPAAFSQGLVEGAQIAAQDSFSNQTFVTGVNVATDAIQSNDSNMMEAVVKFIAISIQLAAVVWGVPTIISGVVNMASGKHDALSKVLVGAAGILSTSMASGCVSWLVG